MYNPSDIYVSGGSDGLRVCWTDKVTKSDASSFYNWEQDNLPLHDLEERDHLLWEKLGHPTSALTGMSFVVSADATSSCNPTYFTTLSSCLDALPEVINCPILVEVASFGDIGDLHLSNKAFGSNGSLEIINRQASYGTEKLSTTNYLSQHKDHATTTWGYLASSIGPDGWSYAYSKDSDSLPALTCSSTITPHSLVGHLLGTVYSTGELVSSGANSVEDSRYYDSSISVFSRNNGKNNNRMTVAIKSSGSIGGSSIPWNQADGFAEKQINFLPYDIDDTNRSDEYMDTYDVSTVDQKDGSEVVWGIAAPGPGATTAGADGYAPASYSYLNSLNSIKIDNCKGPLYIRGFTVDGGASHTLDNGIEIINSKVILERCSASRFGKAGLRAVNSEVAIYRGFAAFRIYSFDSNDVRVGVPYSNKRTLELTPQKDYGAGIRAENSVIMVADTFARDAEKDAQSEDYTPLSLSYGTTDNPAPTASNLFCISRSDIGIDLINSELVGGYTEVQPVSGSTNPWDDSSRIFLESNTECGLRAKNSNVHYKGRVYLYGNHRGLDAKSSNIEIDVLKAQYNQREGLRLDDSTFIYGQETYPGYAHLSEGRTYGAARDPGGLSIDQITLQNNGQGIHAINSTIKPVMVSSMPDTYQGIYISDPIGTEFGKTDTKVLPAIHLHNSYADLVHASILRNVTSTSKEPSYGDAILADSNSTVFLRGSNRYATRVLGPTAVSDQIRKAGLAALNNSNIHLQGPTVIARFGVDALADKNSNIYIEPHRDTRGSLLVSAFDLETNSNHTMVELHSSRSCLVADHGSTIEMEDVGSYHPFWEIGAYGSAIALSDYDYLKDSEAGVDSYNSYVSGGYVQFYANATGKTTEALPTANVSAAGFSTDSLHPAGVSLGNTSYSYLHYFTADALDISAVTTGGMCLRALNQSKVDVNNVHFPTGWPNPSATFYDYGGSLGACSRLHIWNIADNSQLNARYTTVSGVHPRDSGYYGPSGTWGASSAPDSTPDTSSLSVLDYYGADLAGESAYGKSSVENFGAFRLYFSTDPVANFLVDTATVVSGVPYQVFSQGYNFSGSLSAPGTVSAFYTSILEPDSNGVLAPSSFYYASAMLHSPTMVKAILDDSSSNTFANAKHNTVGKSGLGKVVSIYNAYDGVFGGDSVTTKTTGDGIGSVNNFDLKKDN